MASVDRISANKNNAWIIVTDRLASDADIGPEAGPPIEARARFPREEGFPEPAPAKAAAKQRYGRVAETGIGRHNRSNDEIRPNERRFCRIDRVQLRQHRTDDDKTIGAPIDVG